MEINRVEVIAAVVYEMISGLPKERQQKAYVHLFGTAQTAGLIALRRGLDAELAQICGLLHDYYKFQSDIDEDHAGKGADAVMPILAKTGLFSVCEIGNITRAIANHSDKENVGLPLDEVLKDADIFQHILQNVTYPMKDKYVKRYEKLKKEFSL